MSGRVCRQALNFGFHSVFFLLLSLVLFEFMSLPARLQIALRCGVEFPRKNSMNSMTATPDGMMAVGSRFGGIAFYTADGQLQQTVLKDVKIRDVGFLSDGRCVVINTENKITLYTSTWDQTNIRFESLSYDDGGIGRLTVDSDDQIYVSYSKAMKILVFTPAGGKAIREIPCDVIEPMQITGYDDVLIVQWGVKIVIIDKKGNIKYVPNEPSDYSRHAAVSRGNSVLIASVRHEEGLLSIDEYTTELKHLKILISDFKIEKPKKRFWYYLQQFRSGEIAFCTPDRLYIFHQSKILVD